MSDKARLMSAQGIDVISLAGGEPDFDTPAHITEAGFKAVQEGATHYVSSRGIPPSRPDPQTSRQTHGK